MVFNFDSVGWLLIAIIVRSLKCTCVQYLVQQISL